MSRLFEVENRLQDCMKHENEKYASMQTRCISLSQLIESVTESTRLNRTEALSTVSILFNTIKDHLLHGHDVHLGELGTLFYSLENANSEKQALSIDFCPGAQLQTLLIAKSAEKETVKSH